MKRVRPTDGPGEPITTSEKRPKKFTEQKRLKPKKAPFLSGQSPERCSGDFRFVLLAFGRPESEQIDLGEDERAAEHEHGAQPVLQAEHVLEDLNRENQREELAQRDQQSDRQRGAQAVQQEHRSSTAVRRDDVHEQKDPQFWQCKLICLEREKLDRRRPIEVADRLADVRTDEQKARQEESVLKGGEAG